MEGAEGYCRCWGGKMDERNQWIKSRQPLKRSAGQKRYSGPGRQRGEPERDNKPEEKEEFLGQRRCLSLWWWDRISNLFQAKSGGLSFCWELFLKNAQRLFLRLMDMENRTAQLENRTGFLENRTDLFATFCNNFPSYFLLIKNVRRRNFSLERNGK